MLFLPPIESYLYEFLASYEPLITFLIDDELFCLDKDDEEAIYVINTKTLKVGIYRVNLELNFRELYSTAIVHNKRAYIWNRKQQFFYEARADRSNFDLGVIKTLGSEQFQKYGLSFGYEQGTDSFYCVIDYDEETYTHSLYRVNLKYDTLKWFKYDFNFRDKRTLKYIKENRLTTDVYEKVFVTGHYVHIFSAEDWDFPNRTHLILDLLTMEWSMDRSFAKQIGIDISRTIEYFTYDEQMWMISNTNKKNMSNIHRFHHRQSRWIMMSTIPDYNNRNRIRTMIVNVGSRVFFRVASITDWGTFYLTSLCILEMDPSLFELAASVIAENRIVSRAAHASLPSAMKCRLTDMQVLKYECRNEQWKESACEIEDTEQEKEEEEEEEEGDADDDSDWIDHSIEEKKIYINDADADEEYEMRNLRKQHRLLILQRRRENALFGCMNWLIYAEGQQREGLYPILPLDEPEDIEEIIRKSRAQYKIQKLAMYVYGCVQISPISRNSILCLECVRIMYALCSNQSLRRYIVNKYWDLDEYINA